MTFESLYDHSISLGRYILIGEEVSERRAKELKGENIAALMTSKTFDNRIFINFSEIDDCLSKGFYDTVEAYYEYIFVICEDFLGGTYDFPEITSTKKNLEIVTIENH
jgi:hypothetical protein